MESIYLYDLTEFSSEIIVNDIETINHIKALRLKTSEEVFVSNGKGISAKGFFLSNKNHYFFKIKEFNFKNFNENRNNLSILISALENRERMEFAIEKSVELGIANIFICYAQHSGKKIYKEDRVKMKILAAFQQSMRTILPNAIFLNDLFDIFNENHYFSEVYIADIDGENLDNLEIKKNSLIIVGPEGGLSDFELHKLKNNELTKFFKLGNTRLRAETAVISAISIFNNKLLG